MTRPRGLSLLEVVIAMSLLALAFLFVLAIVPAGITSIKRSEDIEAATAYGMEIMEEARRSLPPEGEKLFFIELNQTEFKIMREVVRVNQDLTDIVIRAKWSDVLPGITLATRVHGQPAGSRP